MTEICSGAPEKHTSLEEVDAYNVLGSLPETVDEQGIRREPAIIIYNNIGGECTTGTMGEDSLWVELESKTPDEPATPLSYFAHTLNLRNPTVVEELVGIDHSSRNNTEPPRTPSTVWTDNARYDNGSTKSELSILTTRLNQEGDNVTAIFPPEFSKDERHRWLDQLPKEPDLYPNTATFRTVTSFATAVEATRSSNNYVQSAEALDESPKQRGRHRRIGKHAVSTSITSIFDRGLKLLSTGKHSANGGKRRRPKQKTTERGERTTFAKRATLAAAAIAMVLTSPTSAAENIQDVPTSDKEVNIMPEHKQEQEHLPEQTPITASAELTPAYTATAESGDSVWKLVEKAYEERGIDYPSVADIKEGVELTLGVEGQTPSLELGEEYVIRLPEEVVQNQ